MELYLIFLFGFIIGFAVFSGYFAYLLNFPLIWVFNDQLPTWYYYINITFISILIGLACIGAYEVLNRGCRLIY